MTTEVIQAEVIPDTPPAVPPSFQPPAVPRAASVEVAVQREIAEVQASVVVARACPRDEQKAKQIIEQSCKDPAFAEIAFYAVPRGKDVAEGGSINLALEIARHWGNLQYSVINHGPTVQDGSTFSQMEVNVWDVQANSRYSSRFMVKHFRYTKNGGYPVADPTQVKDLVNAETSKELRNGIFKFVPRSLTNQLKLICDATVANAGAAKDRINKAVEIFAGAGIGADKLEKLLGKTLAQAGGEDAVTLLRVWKAIEQGASIDDFFGETVEEKQPEKQSARKPRQPKEKETEAPKQEPEPAEPEAAQPATNPQQPW